MTIRDIAAPASTNNHGHNESRLALAMVNVPSLSIASGNVNRKPLGVLQINSSTDATRVTHPLRTGDKLVSASYVRVCYFFGMYVGFSGQKGARFLGLVWRMYPFSVTVVTASHSFAGRVDVNSYRGLANQDELRISSSFFFSNNFPRSITNFG